MNSSALPSIAAVVAAAGRSQRMGRFKPLLPWKTSTVIATVVNTLHTAGADPVVCVIGYRADELRAALQRTPAIIAYNPQYAEGEMLQSYQTGVAVLLPDPADAPAGSRDEALDRPQDRSDAEQFCGTLLALGDQPHLPVEIVRQVLDQARRTPRRIVIPSYNLRRGHPIYLPRFLWRELLSLGAQESLRTLLRRHHEAIEYVTVDTDAILLDMDTPEQYDDLRGRI
jgi:molybdenum cofactor cytidylyltransferase